MEISKRPFFRPGLIVENIVRHFIFSIFYFIKEGGVYYAASATYFLILGLLPSLALLAQLIYKPLSKLVFLQEKICEFHSFIVMSVPNELLSQLSLVKKVVFAFLQSASFSLLNGLVFLGFLLAFVRALNFGLEKFLKLEQRLKWKEKIFSFILLVFLSVAVFLASFFPYLAKVIEAFIISHLPGYFTGMIKFILSPLLSNSFFIVLFGLSFGLYELFFHHLKSKKKSIKAAFQFVLSILFLKIFFGALFSGTKFDSFKVLGQLLYAILLGILWLHSIILSFYFASIHFLSKEG